MSNWKKILHPVRMEIIQVLAGNKELTTTQLSDYIPNIPHATLYRHIKYLHDMGMIVVQEEKQKRGAVERTYSLAKNAESIPTEDINNMTKADNMELFTHFMSTIFNDFGNYLEQGDIDILKDGVGYRQGIYYLSDEEFKEMIQDISKVFQKYQQFEPNGNRTKRKFTTIIIPEKGAKKDE